MKDPNNRYDKYGWRYINSIKGYWNDEFYNTGPPVEDWDEVLRKTIKDADELNLENVTLED